jgi:hypothetical protein
MDLENNSMQSDDGEKTFEFSPIYVNKPFFDWKTAEEEFGLVFNIFSENGFENFIQEKFLGDLFYLRKCFILRDYMGIRFVLHKFRGSFK